MMRERARVAAAAAKKRAAPRAPLGRMGTGLSLREQHAAANKENDANWRATEDATSYASTSYASTSYASAPPPAKKPRTKPSAKETAAAEASTRVAMKGLRRRVAALEAELAGKDDAFEEERMRLEREVNVAIIDKVEREKARLEEERVAMRLDLKNAIELERQMAAEEARREMKAAEKARRKASDATTTALRTELASERARGAELIGIIAQQSKDLAKGGAADVAARLAALDESAGAREADLRRDVDQVERERGELRAALADAEAATRRAEEERDVAAARCDAARRELEDARTALARETAAKEELLARRAADDDDFVAAAATKKEDAAAAATAATDAERASRFRAEARAMKRAIDELRAKQDELRAESVAAAAAASENMSIALRGVRELGKTAAVAVERCATARKERQTLSNRLLELKGNIRVFLRVRPISAREEANGDVAAVSAVSALEAKIEGGKRYELDHVAGPSASQSEIFEEIEPLIRSCLDGYDVCVFAYGQTGSGKTYTMEGTPADRGITFRSLASLFREAESDYATSSYSFSCTMMEIYNDKVRDLLEPDAANPKPHDIRQGADGTPYVTDLERVNVSSTMDVMAVMRVGGAARKTGQTDMNATSSRSHLIFTITVTATSKTNAGRGEVTTSRLNLVDLAGSERLSKTNATGERLREARHINKSLSALGNCLNALAEKQQSATESKTAAKHAAHVPFRDCKLTHILSPCLGGDSKTLMFVHAGPAASDASESACTLEFASRVRNVSVTAARKNNLTAGGGGGGGSDGKLLARAREELCEKNARILALQRELETAKEKADVRNPS